MNIPFIKKLLDKYFSGETTVEEEQTLKNFFTQKNIPEELQTYQSWFLLVQDTQAKELDEEFDSKLLEKIQTNTKKEVKLNHWHSFYRAVAIVAIIFTFGTIGQLLFQKDTESPLLDYPYTEYEDTYADQQTGLKHAVKILEMISEDHQSKNLEDSTLMPSYTN